MMRFSSRSDVSQARGRILDAALELLQISTETVSTGDIAVAAGVSRQTLHQHFSGKAEVFKEVSRLIDTVASELQDLSPVDESAGAIHALRQMVARRGNIEAFVHPIMTGIERLRHVDTAAAEAWAQREELRARQAMALVERLTAEGCLASGWSREEAAALIWSTTSHRAWSELVLDAGWTAEQWTDRTTTLLENALVG